MCIRDRNKTATYVVFYTDKLILALSGMQVGGILPAVSGGRGGTADEEQFALVNVLPIAKRI